MASSASILAAAGGFVFVGRAFGGNAETAIQEAIPERHGRLIGVAHHVDDIDEAERGIARHERNEQDGYSVPGHVGFAITLAAEVGDSHS